MRAFIVLCFVAVACADKLGYNYRPVDHSTSGLSFTPGGGSGGLDFGLGSSTGSSFGGSIGGPSYGGGNFGAGSQEGQAFGGQGGGVDKEFYSFTANEDDFVEPGASNQYANGGKQGLRVIFIKGPENNGLENAALALAKQAAEQKTAIYVLNKQPDLSGLADKLNTANSNINNKPEVHFVKYRTPEDAANAQRAIQGQYDQLGGSSQNFNGGVAPVLNFASQAPAGHGSFGHGSFGQGSLGHGSQGSFGHGSQGSFGAGPSSSYLAPGVGGLSPNYLPASIFRRFRHK